MITSHLSALERLGEQNPWVYFAWTCFWVWFTARTTISFLKALVIGYRRVPSDIAHIRLETLKRLKAQRSPRGPL